MAYNWSLDDPDVANLFTHKYEGISKVFHNNKTFLINNISKTYDAVGDQVERVIPVGIAGGVGGNKIPIYNSEKTNKMIFTTQAMYGSAEVNRKTLKQAANKGAFVGSLEYLVKGTVKGFTWMHEILLMGSKNGALGTVSVATDSGSGNFSCTITAATWIRAHWEPKTMVNFGTSDGVFEVVSVTPSTKTVVFKRYSGSNSPANSDVVYLQGYAGGTGAPSGLRWACDNSGVKYNITSGYRWESQVIDAGSATLDEDVIDQLVTNMSEDYDAPDTIILPYTQLRMLKQTLAGQKRYTLNPISTPAKGGLSATLSYKNYVFDGPSGQILFHPSRFCYDHEIFAVKLADCEIAFTPGGPTWVNENGGVWEKLARPNDGFYANYACYCEHIMPPPSVGRIHTLATS
jgi:hypothetical protein